MKIKTEFIIYWNEIRKVAEECSRGFDILEKHELSSSVIEQEQLTKEFEALNLVDPDAIWYIGLMIRNINRAIMDNRPNLNVIDSMGQVNGCLNSDNYWSNVWENNISSIEAQNLKKLASMMGKLISLM